MPSVPCHSLLTVIKARQAYAAAVVVLMRRKVIAVYFEPENCMDAASSLYLSFFTSRPSYILTVMLQPRIARLCFARASRYPSALTRSRSISNSALCKNDQISKAVIGQTAVPVDEDGIPLKPSYSIKTFLSNLPAPSISDEQFIHLHKLAALIPPPTGTPEFAEKKKALEEMVRLVEGVRPDPIDLNNSKTDTIPDGRIWPENEGIQIDWDAVLESSKAGKRSLSSPARTGSLNHEGKALLDLAEKQVAGYYVVKKRQAADVE